MLETWTERKLNFTWIPGMCLAWPRTASVVRYGHPKLGGGGAGGGVCQHCRLAGCEGGLVGWRPQEAPGAQS